VIEVNVNVPEVDMMEMRYRIRDELGNGSEGGLIAITANVRITFGYWDEADQELASHPEQHQVRIS
jgi:hypothetical protein